MVAPTETIEIDYLHRTMTVSEAVVIATLPEGGTLRYNVGLTRDVLGWKINNIELVFASQPKDPKDN
jgi:hypothetical protein